MLLSSTNIADNAIVRFRGKCCVVSTVAAPFVTGYWPDVKELFLELGLTQTDVEAVGKLDAQRRFLSVLADKAPETEVFRPKQIGFKWRAEDVRSYQEFSANHCTVTFFGDCSQEVLIGTLDALEHRVGNSKQVDVRFKDWDVLGGWQCGKDRLSAVSDHLQFRKLHHSSLIILSSFKELPDDFWEYLYDWPQMRVGWQADDLAGFGDLAQFEQYRRENPSFINLENLSNKGIFPHIVLPATKVNTKILPELARALMAAMGGGTIEIVPVPLLPKCGGIAPAGEDYAAAIMAIHKDAPVPLSVIAPSIWAVERINSHNPLISSPEAAGASLAVLANGDVYAAEAAVGLDQWRLGNILEDGVGLHWERLDAMPEVFSSATKPEECKACDWRFRCGGVDASVLLLKEREVSTDWQTMFQLYCAPRKAIFEEALWDSVAGLVAR